VSGRNVDIATYAGRPVVINIWASWCPGCNQEAADLERFAQRHPEAQLVGVDIQDNSSAAKAFYQRWGWHHPSVNDPDERIASRLGLQGLPTTIFLDARHRIVTRIVGASNLSGFEQGLRLAKHA
jgi:thiol-disulfide isomerase/thioredoxin